jgi:hypothetical protein
MTTAAIDEDLATAYTRELHAAGWHIERIYRIVTPRDPLDEVEVLFVGRLRSEPNAPLEALTGYCEANKTPVIGAGW